MKKLIVTVVGLLMVVLLIGGCGADTSAGDCLDDFFNEYYSECIQYCDTCAKCASMCSIDYQATTCVESRWSYGSSNDSCVSGEREVITMIEGETKRSEEKRDSMVK